MGTLIQDLRYGVRMLLKSPGFTTVVVLALALGIGANTAIFSVVNAVLLRPLPFENPEQLVMIWATSRINDQARGPLSAPDASDLIQQSQSLEYLAPYQQSGSSLANGDDTERVYGANVPADIFPLLRAKPAMGRTFTREEDVPGGPSVVVISQGLWQRRFGSDPAIIGKEIKLSNKGYTVIGVMASDFRFPIRSEKPDFWIPLSSSPSYTASKDIRGNRSLRVVARLKPGVTIAQAQSEFQTIARRLEEQYPDTNTGLNFNPMPLHEDIVGGIRPALLVILGAVGFVLLIACANVANLLLARAAARHKEIAIRTALGASRMRVVRQLLTESVLLALVGGGLGLLIAMWGVDLLVAASPAALPRVREIGLDARVLGFTAAVALLTGILFGLAPALQSSRLDLNESLKEGGRGSTESLRRNRVRSLLVVSEVALSLVLLIGAGLLIRSFVYLLNVSPGFDTQAILTVDLPLSRSKYPTGEQQAAFVEQAIERTRQTPGVASVAAVNIVPLSGNGRQSSFTVEGRPVPPGQEPDAEVSTVTPDYFQTMGIPLRKGRVFTMRDRKDAPPVLVVSETFARRFFPGEEAVGKRLVIDDEQPPYEIVGIVGDIRHKGLETESYPEYYLSYFQSPERQVNLMVRAAPPADPASIRTSVRNTIKQMDKDQLIWDSKTMQQLLEDSVSRQRFNMLLLGIFAALALVLAAVGIYGVMSYSVTQRTHEIGIRIALGAQTGDVLRMVVRQGMTLALVGVGLGLIAAYLVTRVMGSLLYGVTATDAVTFGVVSVVLAGIALLACLIPARRATRVDPMVALRYE
ncbi:MAG TPA: ABC transporter permease [Pyrinomonadaceae bacterium]|jgi:putative ABC transport system permease protein|nr:ABC transporter permease [Pyrinomonadaceae bacterium]